MCWGKIERPDVANGDGIARTSSWERERGGHSIRGSDRVKPAVSGWRVDRRPSTCLLSPFVDAFKWKAETCPFSVSEDPHDDAPSQKRNSSRNVKSMEINDPKALPTTGRHFLRPSLSLEGKMYFYSALSTSS